jgi:hypothetical protein
MAMNLLNILGFGADQPLVELGGDDEIGAAARTPAPFSAAPPTASSPSLPSRSFSDTILGLAPDEGFRRSLAGGLSAAAANYHKPAMAAAMASFGRALGGTSQDREVAALDRAIRAHRIGDMDALKRAFAELHQAQRPPQTAQYGMPNSGAMAPSPAPTSNPAALPAARAPQITAAATLGAPGTADFRARQFARARDAITRGADRNAVAQRLREQGIDPSGL